MKDISMHLMDIAQNSIVAGASKISIIIQVCDIRKMLYFEVIDNGKGMEKDFLRKVTDPFKTTRTTRRVGLGIPLLKQSAEMAGGELRLDSEPGKGTKIQASFKVDHIDRIPIGDIPGTLTLLISANKSITWIVEFKYKNADFLLDTDQINEVLDGVQIDNKNVLEWIQNTISQGINSVFGGVLSEVD